MHRFLTRIRSSSLFIFRKPIPFFSFWNEGNENRARKLLGSHASLSIRDDRRFFHGSSRERRRRHAKHGSNSYVPGSLDLHRDRKRIVSRERGFPFSFVSIFYCFLRKTNRYERVRRSFGRVGNRSTSSGRRTCFACVPAILACSSNGTIGQERRSTWW